MCLVRVDEYRRSTKISNRMRRSTESKTLYANLITRTYTASQQTQVNSSSTSAQRHHLTRQLRAIAVLRNESFQVVLESVHVRSQRHHPVGIESLLHVFLFHTLLAHVGEAQVNRFSFLIHSNIFYIVSPAYFIFFPSTVQKIICMSLQKE